MCGPGLTCVRQEGATVPQCQKMTTSCAIAQQRYDMDLESGNLGMDMLRPECDDQGACAPVQCTGADVCRCVDKETGEPIFGLETNMTRVEGMLCDCARDSVMLKKMGCSMKVKYDGDSKVSRER